MANAPFDRTIINERERPLSTDINQMQSQLDRTMRFIEQQRYKLRSSDASPLGVSVPGFIGDGFQCRAVFPTSLVVRVPAGAGFVFDPADVPSGINGIISLDDLSPWKPVLLLADVDFPVPAAPVGPDSRIDIVEVRSDRRSENPLSRDIFNVGTGNFDPASVDKTLAFALDGRTGVVNAPASSTAGLSYKVGVPGNPPTPPSVTAGYTKIAEVFIDSGVTTVEANDIADFRRMLFPGGYGVCHAHVTRTTAAAAAPTLVVGGGGYHAPPGVDFQINGDNASSTVRVRVRAGLIKSFSVQAHPVGSSPIGSFEIAEIGSTLILTVAEGDALQTSMAGAFNFPGPVAAAPNDLIGEAFIQLIKQTGATTALSADAVEIFLVRAIFGY